MSPQQYEAIQGGIVEPEVPLALHDRKDRATVKWLRDTKIFGLVHRDDVSRGVFRVVLPNRPLREVVERLLLGNVSPREIAYRLRKDLKYTVREDVIAEFQHFFWNTRLMGISDWADYFSADSGNKGRTRPIKDTYLAALHGGPQVAMYRAGIRMEVTSKGLLEELQTELAFTFREVRTLPTSQAKVEMLGTLTRSILKVEEQLLTSDSALQDVLKRFEKFTIREDDVKVPSLADLAPHGTVSDRSKVEIQRGS